MTTTTTHTSATDSARLARHWIDVYNERDWRAEAAVRAPGYLAYAPGEPEPLRDEAWVEFIGGFADGMPDLKLTLEDVVADDDLVAGRVTFTGTHTGELQGLPPTGRRITFNGLEMSRIVDGKVVEHWFQMDQLSLLPQLGLMVVPGPRLLLRIVAHKVRGALSRLASRPSSRTAS